MLSLTPNGPLRLSAPTQESLSTSSGQRANVTRHFGFGHVHQIGLARNKSVLNFELRQTEDGFVLTGGQLPAPLPYPDMDHAIRLVGFLSQKEGSELRVYGLDGKLIDTQTRKSGLPLADNSLGSGLRGTSDLGN